MVPITALALVLIVSPSRDSITLRYPTDALWVCVESHGKIDNRDREGTFTYWWRTSCWKPYWSNEFYRLDNTAIQVKVTLETNVGVEVEQSNIRPEETPLVPLQDLFDF